MIKVKLVRGPRPNSQKFYEVVSPWTHAFWVTMSIFGMLYMVDEVADERKWGMVFVAVGGFFAFAALFHYEKRRDSK